MKRKNRKRSTNESDKPIRVFVENLPRKEEWISVTAESVPQDEKPVRVFVEMIPAHQK